MDTEIAQTPKMWESCVNPKTTYSIIVDGCWKRPKFQSAAFQGLGFLIFDQCSTMNYRSEGSNPSSSVAHEKRHYDDFRELGFEGYEQTPHDLRERRAYQSQLEHSSWRKVSRDFKDRVLKTAVDEYNFIEPIQVPIKSINFLR